MVALDRELRVALVGYGRGGALFHAPYIVATPGLRLAGIVTGNPDRQARAKREHPDAHVLPDIDTLWDNAVDFDVAVIATPDPTHASFARQALESGLSVVVDKPLALDPADARDLDARAAELELVLTVYQNRRWDTDYLTLWNVVDGGGLGRVHRFESRFEGWRPHAAGTWRDSETAAEGGGILNGMGPHLVDQAVNLFGPVSHVYAELDAIRPGVQAEDSAYLTLTHTSGGVRSSVAMSWVAAQPGPRFRLLGSEGAYTVDTAGASPDWGPQPEPPLGRLGVAGDTHPVPAESGAYVSFWVGVRDAVALGEPVPVDTHDVIHGLEVIAAARRSAAEGRVVEV
ncbi:Gfo/Idh/MocA family oxidoreductase [Spiractinospora alimapuensis]|uniref:Gfo/Idh/MocA family protein n=1 Tax=Spiractinospora alimapuensis TaxID=2820884 RepID=UPI001F15DF56|nr:Gfo/Idh/MocA family oxidoreductase [Spiractinospora alimapuensis]QVQ54005.1 Gfo/Idh/MocA family oxidoreductase [Spiractinospora alimapuensis]